MIDKAMSERESQNLSLDEIVLSFHAGKPYMVWIRFDESFGEKPCAKCKTPCRTLVMTSPTGGICDSCWERMG